MTSELSGPASRTPFAYYDPDASSWRTSQASFDLGLHESSVTLPNSGSMRNGALYERPTLALATDANGCSLLPTPQHADGQRTALSPEAHARGFVSLPEAVADLLPTPAAHDSGNTPERHLRAKNELDGGNRTTITSLPVLLRDLLPTPAAADGTGGKTHALGSISSTGMKEDGTKVPVSLQDAVNILLPTPAARDSKGRDVPNREGSPSLPQMVTDLLPTPRSSDQFGSGQHGEGGLDLRTTVASLGDATDPPSSDTSESSADRLPGL